MMTITYYVYLLARPNGKVFYVGKGQLQANIGRPKSAEQKAKISASRKAYFARLRKEKTNAQSGD